MSDGEKEPKTTISKAQSIQEIGEFWDAHSLADHWDETEETSFEVRATRRRRVTIDPQVYAQLEATARTRGVSPETLVNLWLAEYLAKGRGAQQTNRPGQ
jgi:hypothetical protein